MRLWTYTIIMFAISAVLYMMGYSSILGSMGSSILIASSNTATSVNPLSILTMWNNDGSVFDIIMVFLVVLIGAGVITQSLGFGSFYIFPAIIFFAVMNFIVFPFSFILDPNVDMPVILKIPIIALFNIMLVMAIISFIRGTD